MRFFSWIGVATLGLILTVWFALRAQLQRHRWMITCFVIGCLTLLISPEILRQAPGLLHPLAHVPSQAILVLVVIGLVSLAVAAVIYVLFRFMWLMIRLEMQVTREFKTGREALQNLFQRTTKSNESAFIPYSDERQSEIEALQRLKQEGMLTDDQIEDFLKTKAEAPD